MIGTGADLSRAAEKMLGTPFRLHGRDPAIGLDCIGLVSAALEAIGRHHHTPEKYTIRQTNLSVLLPFARASGLIECDGELAPGDIVLARPGPAQFHLLIAHSAQDFIHAHAGLRKVVMTPGPLPWKVIRRWRIS